MAAEYDHRRRFYITRTTIDSLSWTPILAPIDCNHIKGRIEDGSTGYSIRAVSDLPTTQENFQSGEVLIIEGWKGHRDDRGHSEFCRFDNGEIAFYAQSSSGSPEFVVEWIR